MAPLRQPLVDGAQVQVYGTVTVFEAQGQYQLRVEILQPRGIGLLQAKFEALKRKLEAEGLFAPERKRPLPKFPATNRNSDLAERCSRPRHAERAAATRAVVADPDQSGARAGNRCGAGNRHGHSRAGDA